MITWFEDPYPVRAANGFDYLFYGVYVTVAPVAILVDGEGKYRTMSLSELQTDWRWDPKARKWAGPVESND